MLVGRWTEDLEKAIATHVDPTRQAAWGTPDLSSNIFRSISKQLSVLYDRPPVIDHPDGPEPLGPTLKAINAAGLWSLMARTASMVIGCREYGLRVDVSPDGELSFRPVAPNRLIIGADEDRPDYPVLVRELRLRQHPGTKEYQWTWHELDISDPANPVERITAADYAGRATEDLTVTYLGEERSGDAYPYRDAAGIPFIPFVLYHAERTGSLWDSWEGSELVWGSLQIAVFYSLFGHVLRDASWPQRYAIGAIPMGLGLDDGNNKGNRRAISTDPASILMFQADGDLQPSLGQFNPGADVGKMLEAISSYEQRISEFGGISPADLQRLGGTARSGTAISISNNGKRIAQRKYEPQFRAGDTQLIAVCSKLVNRATGGTAPETGHTIRYQAIPMSEQERESQRKDIMEKINAGIMSKADAYMDLHPGISRARAIQELHRIRVEEAIAPAPAAGGFGAADGGTTAPPVDPNAAPEVNEDGTITDIGEAADRLALNGAQVTAAQGIVEAVAAGALPRDTGLNMLIEFFSIPPASANRIMGTVGLGFVRPTPTTE
tara:strand:+ start:1086 stop:2741 length:1656 start_codon:yes stop_codon:yes gene_type:complete